MERFNVPGVIVSFQQKKTYIDFNEGVADIRTNTKPNSCWEWPLRSVTKMYTVELISHLVKIGSIRWDDAIDKYLTEPIQHKDIITIEQLANMSSGIADYVNNPVFQKIVDKTPSFLFTLDELNFFGYNQTNVFFPGTNFSYSNTNTNLLGKIIENVTGKSYKEYLYDTILIPLKLKSTNYLVRYDNWEVPHATGYEPTANDSSEVKLQESPKISFSALGPAGAMVSNVYDLHKYIRYYTSPKRYPYKINRFMALDNKSPEYDTYGICLGKIGDWLGHTGEGFGFQSLIMYNACLDISVVIFCNISDTVRHVPTTIFRNITTNINIVTSSYGKSLATTQGGHNTNNNKKICSFYNNYLLKNG